MLNDNCIFFVLFVYVLNHRLADSVLVVAALQNVQHLKVGKNILIKYVHLRFTTFFMLPFFNKSRSCLISLRISEISSLSEEKKIYQRKVMKIFLKENTCLQLYLLLLKLSYTFNYIRDVKICKV